ncbi:MAG TPA: 4-(cytidine 5'-diphospho)-2-C-methyl-D-erythritol kinase [Caulobacteraceae bacterium]|nr:4-(cytidine 5'-diphospho)-2-C-methyl-D-erythritol kinase [Caulobacteraceae bacterium]
MSLERFAPAKVNLFLHVGPLQADGYHPICSLMTFAGVGDRVRLEPAPQMSFAVEGPFAAELGGDGAGNLVVRARDALLAAFPDDWAPFRISLEKNLPVAAGLGGGSSDAAAALHLIAGALVRDEDRGRLRGRGDAWFALSQEVRDELSAIAARLGSDVPVCLGGVPAIAEGRGEACDWPPVFPDLDAVLVNPLVASPTGAVYRAYDEAGAPGSAERPPWPEALESPAAVAAWLADTRNDLEAPAVGLTPAIGEVLATLRAQPQTLLARMSGSGATCFAICASDHLARDLALAIADAHPGWWVQACGLAGYHP